MFNYELPDLTKLTAADLEGNSPLQDYISKQLMALLTQKQNLHGRRVGKAKDAINPGDYVTKRQLNGTLVGTLAQRPNANNVTVGTTYYATDRGVTYISRGGHWYYYLGVQEVTLSPNTKPTPSVLYDYGYLIYATDFDWYYEWVLTGWRRLGGANLYIQGFVDAPTKAGWHVADGATVTYSKDDGTTGSGALFNLIGAPGFLRFDSTAIETVAPVAPTVSGSTGIESTKHTHNVTGTIGISGTIPAYSYGFSTSSGTSVTTAEVSNGAVSGSVIQSFEDCSFVIPDEDFGGASVVNCGAAYELFGAGLNSTAVTIAFEGTAFLIDETPFNFSDYLSASFTDGITDDDSVDHTHPGSSLTVSSTGTPRYTQLIPYVRL